MDRILEQYPEAFLLVPPFKTYVIGEILYHELGHHIHRIEEPGYRTDKEAVANQWKEELLQEFLLQRYWYLAKVIDIFRPVFNPLVSWLRRA